MSSTIFKQVNYTLDGLINDIDLGKIGLPDIQRPFVWTNTKVRDLFDSMYKGYPVGYLLFWDNDYVPGHRTIGANGKQLSPNMVIVDGQQRLTSLFAVMNGVSVVRSNYKSERIRIAFNPLERIFSVATAATDRDRSFISDISTVWSSDTSLFDVANEFLDDLREARDVSNDEQRFIQDSIAKLAGLSNFPFTALQLNADITEEDVADVFVRINSQGKTLNQADFILTLMSVFWDEGRTNLETFCRDSKVPSSGPASPYNHLIEPSPAQLLRVGIGLAFRRARLRSVYSILRGKDLATNEFSDQRRDKQFDALKGAQEKTLNLTNWHGFIQCIRQAGYREGRMINSSNTLLYSYVFYLIGKTEFDISDSELRSLMAQWFFMSAITGRYAGSPESTAESDLAMLRGTEDGDEFARRLRRACDVALPHDFWEVTLPNELATSSARSPSLFAYEAALVLLDAPALFSKFKVAEMIDPTLRTNRNLVERHHMFPRGHLARNGVSQPSEINQIANYAYVEWPDNASISDQAPADYLPEMLERFSETELRLMYRFHALPDGWEHMNYWRFLELRRELMAAIIREGYERLMPGSREHEADGAAIDIDELVNSGEGDAIEFKSTLRTNMHTRKVDKRMELAVLKTLAGFLNSDGGTLIVGVSDDGAPIGIETDGFANEDKMALHLGNIVNRSMGPSVWALVHANFEDYEGDRVLVVRCEKSRSPIYLQEGNDECFYIRTGHATTELNVSQVQEYIKQRFG